MTDNREFRLPEQGVLAGFFWGAVLGGVVALVRAPRLHATEKLQQLQTGVRDRLEQLETAVTPSDPIDESLAEGKAAARRRLAELGLTPDA